MDFPFTWSLQMAYLPMVVSSEEKKPENICFLIDTGSTNNTIFTYAYDGLKEELGDEFEKVFRPTGETRSSFGLDGEMKEELPIVEATFSFQGEDATSEDYTSKFVLLDATEAMKQVFEETKVQVHGILGVNFLLQHGWVIDFHERKIKSREDNQQENK